MFTINNITCDLELVFTFNDRVYELELVRFVQYNVVEVDKNTTKTHIIQQEIPILHTKQENQRKRHIHSIT